MRKPSHLTISVSTEPGPLLPPPAWPLTPPSSGFKEAEHPSAGDNRQVRPHIDPEEKSWPKCSFVRLLNPGRRRYPKPQ